MVKSPGFPGSSITVLGGDTVQRSITKGSDRRDPYIKEDPRIILVVSRHPRVLVR